MAWALPLTTMSPTFVAAACSSLSSSKNKNENGTASRMAVVAATVIATVMVKTTVIAVVTESVANKASSSSSSSSMVTNKVRVTVTAMVIVETRPSCATGNRVAVDCSVCAAGCGAPSMAEIKWSVEEGRQCDRTRKESQ